MRQGFEWAVTKAGMPPVVKRGSKTEYPHHERSVKAYNHYLSGYTEEEIAAFLTHTEGEDVSVEQVQMDIQHIQSLHPVRTLIAHNNDRERLLLQRTQSSQYRRLLTESLSIPAEAWVAGGMSPVGPLKEFREAVGMTEKSGGFAVNLNQNNLNVSAGAGSEGGSGGRLASSEDLLRRVMGKLQENHTKSLPPGTEDSVIEADAIESEPDPEEEITASPADFELEDTIEEDRIPDFDD